MLIKLTELIKVLTTPSYVNCINSVNLVNSVNLPDSGRFFDSKKGRNLH